MPHAKADEAFFTCERLRQAVERYPWVDIHPDLQVTMSFGLSSDIYLDSHEQVLSQADSRLYEAKREGRNRVIRSRSDARADAA
jgi:diguanylate cyclase (GGDEF)-like protein